MDTMPADDNATGIGGREVTPFMTDPYTGLDLRAVKPLDPVPYIIIGHVLIVCGALGMMGNGAVIALIRLNKGLRGPFHRLLEANSWANFGIACLGNPLSAAAALSNRWHFGQVGCDYYGFVMTLCGIASINFITTISVERYLSICRPHVVMTDKLVTASIALGTLAALAWAVFPLVGWSHYHTDGIGIGCCPTLDPNPLGAFYSLAIVVFEAFIPMLIMAVCHTKIVLTVGRSGRRLAEHAISVSPREQAKNKAWRVAKIVSLANGAFLLAWGPYTVASIYFAFRPEEISVMVNTISVLLAKCSTIWNPIIYMVSHRQYQLAFIKLLDRGGTSMMPSSGDKGASVAPIGINGELTTMTAVPTANGKKTTPVHNAKPGLQNGINERIAGNGRPNADDIESLAGKMEEPNIEVTGGELYQPTPEQASFGSVYMGENETPKKDGRHLVLQPRMPHAEHI